MRRLLGLVALGLATLAAGAGPAAATGECNGLTACVPVAGPWVVVPAPSPPASRRQVEYQLSCPRSFTVGGLDAELSSRQIEIGFIGLLGGPVNPGITTSSSAVFVAATTAAGGGPASFRPHIGCMPSSRAGGVPPTVYRAPRAFAAPAPVAPVPVFAPGQPAVRRAEQVDLRPSRRRLLTLACARGQRLLQGSRAVAFYTRRPPSQALMGAVSTTLSVDTSRVSVVATTSATIAGVHAVVQLQAVCAGGA